MSGFPHDAGVVGHLSSKLPTELQGHPGLCCGYDGNTMGIQWEYNAILGYGYSNRDIYMEYHRDIIILSLVYT